MLNENTTNAEVETTTELHNWSVVQIDTPETPEPFIVTEVNDLQETLAAMRREVEHLRVVVSELAAIALGDDKFNKWFDDRFGTSLTDLVEEQVRETIEDIVDDSYIEERFDMSNYDLNDYIDTDAIARQVIESDTIQDKMEEIVNDAIDGIEVQLVR